MTDMRRIAGPVFGAGTR